jgi:hypothetical protein
VIERTKYLCKFCDRTFNRSDNLARHINYCPIKKLNEEEKEIKNTLLEKENKLLKDMLSTAGRVAQTSTSTLNYLVRNYKSTPVLKKLNDYSIMFEDNKIHFIKDIIFYHKNKDLHRYLSDFIIDNYKKEDPKDQAIWNSDTVRLTYIIKDIMNKKEEWTTDKKGVKTNEYIIEPMLKYIKEILLEYVDDQRIQIIKVVGSNNKIAINKEITIVVDIITNIDNKTLAFEIIKYIAPHFYLNNKENIKLIEN